MDQRKGGGERGARQKMRRSIRDIQRKEGRKEDASPPLPCLVLMVIVVAVVVVDIGHVDHTREGRKEGRKEMPIFFFDSLASFLSLPRFFLAFLCTVRSALRTYNLYS